MKFLLSLITVCLVMITAKLYIPMVNAEAEVDTTTDEQLEERILKLVGENCRTDKYNSSRYWFECKSTSALNWSESYHR